jgi:uncharacterized glyoxalase superfamily protein PhnB
MTKAIPEGYHTITPAIVHKDVRKAIEFYKKAFGAAERYVMPCPDGKGVMHAELKIGDSLIMLGEEGAHCPAKSAQTLGGSPIGLYLYVQDVDAAFRRAIGAGAVSRMPVQDMFWGDRTGSVTDPFGYSWTLATHIKDLSPEEIAEGAEEFFAATAKR